ncbi:hypothetical protein CYMTET_28012, partial [Cymbomonas tetramitiformis]
LQLALTWQRMPWTAAALGSGEEAEQKPSGSGKLVTNEARLVEAMCLVSSRIIHGDPLTERKSTFQAHLASVTSADQAKAVVAVLIQNRKIAAATHNMVAYRVHLGNGVWAQDCDDDGETAAGSRMLHLLQTVDAEDVVVVVSRWYGGIKLGPDRFKLINNCARQLLDLHGYVKSSNDKGERSKSTVPKSSRKQRK